MTMPQNSSHSPVAVEYINITVSRLITKKTAQKDLDGALESIIIDSME